MPLIQDILHLGNQLILIGHIEYIPGSEDIVGQTTQSILGSNTVLVVAQNDTNGRIVIGIIDLVGIVVQIHIDLACCLRG